MDIEKPERQWAKSTQSRIQLFLDSYIIRSPIHSVRISSQKLILSLFKKGTQQQRTRIMSLLQSRCQGLRWMGKASEEFLNLVKNIFNSTEDYVSSKGKIIKQIFCNLQRIHENVISDPNYQFYSFSSNIIDFGNQQFKPYLLQANGCLNCFGKTEQRAQPFKFDTYVQTTKLFTNKLEYVFKRVYDVKQLTINLRVGSKVRGITPYYIDKNKQQKKINPNNSKYKPGDIINAPSLTLQGLVFQFDLILQGHKKTVKCVFCEGSEDLNAVCSNCLKKTDLIEIGGHFRIVGADQNLIAEQLCQDYQKIQQNLASIRALHSKMQSKQKISLNFKLDQMVNIYQKIVNNLSLLHDKNPSKIKCKEDLKCFSCNYYQVVSIIKFLKEVMKKCDSIMGEFTTEQIQKFKGLLRVCLQNNQVQFLRVNILQTLAVLIVNMHKKSDKIDYKQQFQNNKNKYTADLISKVLISLKQKQKNSQSSISIQDELNQIKQYLEQNSRDFKIEEKIKIFVCFFIDWEFLSLVVNNSFNHATEINRLTIEQFNQLKFLINFDIKQIFNIPLDSTLKCFLKILPQQKIPTASLDIADYQFLQYVDNKIPEIQKSRIEQSVILCPYPMIKLNQFDSLPILISKLPVKESMKIMNSLFPFRNVWNLNVIKACNKFDAKLSQLTPQEQIYTCLYGYCKSKENLYIQKIYKLMVPQRTQFIIRFQAPLNQIQQNGVQYPYLPIRQVKSQDLAGDTIKSLHDWVYAELVKLNQAMPLDIIVQKNIIDNLDMPIQIVYQNAVESKQKRRIGDKQYDFFRVIYRIQGMFGQPKQRSIGNLRDQRLQTCISYASFFLNKFSEEFNRKIGLDVLIGILEEIQPGTQFQNKKVLLFEILSTISMNEAICKKIVEDQYGDSIINATVRLMSFQNQKDAKITNFLLTLSSRVIDQANQEMINLRKGSVGQYRKTSGGMDIQQIGNITESQKKVKFVLDKIAQCQSSYQKSGNVLYRDISRKLIKLLPFCSKDQLQSSRILFNFFEFSNWNTKYSSKMQNLFIFMESLSQSYMTFKSISGQNGVTNQIIKTILNAIRKQGTQAIDEKKLSSNKLQTESALLLLCTLLQGDEQLQGNLFQSKIFHNIYQISQIPPKRAQQIHAGRVPEYCYKIIKYLSQGKIVDRRISEFLNEKKKIDKQKMEPNKRKRMQMMKQKQQLLLQKKMVDEGQEGQKDLVICSSCQQGYRHKKQILGLYIFLTKNQIPPQNNWWKDNRRQASFSSTTYFTAIHFECHMRAYEADQKIPRSQWDGALIRNMDVLCNSWIPFKGPKTTIDQFSRVERKYFQKNKNGNYWNVVNDLCGLLQKLSIQFDFATQSKGSSSSHNCRYIPILIGFSCHLIERSGGCANIEEGIAYLLENPPKRLGLINYFLCYSIFTQSYDWFQKNKETFFKWISTFKTQQGTQQKRFEQLKPHLVFYKLVEQIFELVHKQINLPAQNPPLKMFKQVETHLSQNLQQTIPKFQALRQRYKNKYIKLTTIAEFQA